MSGGSGLSNYVLGQFESYGNDTIQVETKVPSTGKTSASNATGQAMGIQITTLKVSDGEQIKKLPNVVGYAAGTIGQELVVYKNENKRVMLFGNSADLPEIDRGVKISEGNFYTKEDDDNLAQVVVIGQDVKKNFFADEDPIGKDLKIKGMNFRVVGVAAERGSVTFFNYDELIYIPVQTLEKKILGIDYVRYITVRVKDASKVDVTAADITDLLRRIHHTNKPEQEDFSVTTMQEAQKMVTDVFGTINILLLALTSISLIVGGVGIMNVMYVAVVERTFEIGLRKSVGAKSADILKQFLMEAIIITLIGGLAGIVFGFIFTQIFSYIFTLLGFNLKLVMSMNSVLVAVGFSATTGIIFGFYPAYKASKLSPMEALRKE